MPFRSGVLWVAKAAKMKTKKAVALGVVPLVRFPFAGSSFGWIWSRFCFLAFR